MRFQDVKTLFDEADWWMVVGRRLFGLAAVKEQEAAKLLFEKASPLLGGSVPKEVMRYCRRWGCSGVLGVCIYDCLNDPAHDSCLFCGQPEERK